MIRKTLALLDGGPITLSEMARELDMTEPDLKNRLEMMVSMGHLEAVYLGSGEAEDGDACHGCVFASVCRDTSCSEGAPVVGYRLTEKGRRLIKGREG